FQARRFLSMVLTFVACLAVGLSSIGLYATMSYTGTQRMREYAMRIAVGARSADVIRLVLTEALLLVVAGTAVGGLMALWTGRVLEHWLYSVHPMDALSLVSAESVLMTISLAASLMPAM